MLTEISAAFQTPDEADAALGRIGRLGLAYSAPRVSDARPRDDGTDDVRLGRYKSLFSEKSPGPRLSDGAAPMARLTLVADRRDVTAIRRALRNSRACEISVRTRLS